MTQEKKYKQGDEEKLLEKINPKTKPKNVVWKKI